MKNLSRKHPLQIYLSDDEYNILIAKTEESGLRSLSAFIRHLIIYGFVYDVDYSQLHEYNVALSRIGNNLNQIAKRVNTNKIASNNDLKEAKKLMEEVWRTQKSMLSKQPYIKQ